MTDSRSGAWRRVTIDSGFRAVDGGFAAADTRFRTEVVATSPHVVHVLIHETHRTPPASWVTEVARAATSARVRIQEGSAELATEALRVVSDAAPWHLDIHRTDGSPLLEADRARGVASCGDGFVASLVLRASDHVFGFGERVGPLDKRGRRLGGSSLLGWNTNASTRDLASDPLYACVPFFMVLRDGRAHGVFLDNPHRSHFDVGRSDPSALIVTVDRGPLDLWIVDGPSPAEVLDRYTALTGRPAMPPRWALGYHQSRYSYQPDARVREIGDELRRRRIPADAIWLDIHHLDRFRPVTWDRTRFPDPEGLIHDLHGHGFRIVTIVDPHPAKVAGDPVWESGDAGGHFVKHADGALLEGEVWPSKAETGPAASVFPDVARASTRRWWGDCLAPLIAQGVDGIWCDMNEPAVFDGPGGTLPLDAVHDADGRTTDHREVHNLYGMLHARATFEALQRARPGRRPFVLTRASFAGGQRFGAIWTGDVRSDHASLRQSIATLLGLGLSGMPFCGADVGGFVGAPSAELFTRWLQAAVLTPFVRVHTEDGTPDQEPWSFGEPWTSINRRAIELRYALLPEIEAAMRTAHEKGVPAMRPLFFADPTDASLCRIDDQFLLGDHLLVAPVLVEGATSRTVRLPRGTWFDWWTGQEYDAGDVTLPVDAETLPMFARAGAIVIGQSGVQHTGEVPAARIVTFFPGPTTTVIDREDDGESPDGAGQRWRSLARDDRRDTVRVRVGATAGAPLGHRRELRLRIRCEAHVVAVHRDGRPMPPLTAASTGATGFSVDGRWVEVVLPDDDGALEIDVLTT